MGQRDVFAAGPAGGTAGPGPDAARFDVAAAVAVAALGLAWGLLAAPRGYADGDASELTLALALAGVPHPTGYPIYVLAGHVVTRLLHACSVAWPTAANAWSAVGCATALFFLHRLSMEVAGPRLRARGIRGLPRAALVTLPFLPLVVQPIWSAASSGAEVYAWHGAWVAWATWSAWRVRSTWHGAGSALRWGVVIGVGLAHHLTSLFLSIPLTAYVALRPRADAGGRGPGLRGVDARAMTLGACIPLLSWGWIAYRGLHPAAFQWPLLEAGWGGLWNHVLGIAYGGYLGGFRPNAAEARLLVASIPWLAVGTAALVATIAMRETSTEARARRSLARTLGVAFLLQSAFVLGYRVPDPAAHVVPLLALGAIFLPDRAAALLARAGTASSALAAAALLVGFLPGSIATDLDSRRAVERTDRILRAAWEGVPFEKGFIYWHNDLYARLRAYQILEGSHRGRVVENPGVLTWDGPRRRFLERYGFDPWAGRMPTRDEDFAALPAITRGAREVPAIDFDDAIRAAVRAEGTPAP